MAQRVICVYASQSTMANVTQYVRRTTIRAIKQLVSLGLIKSKRRRPQGKDAWRTNLYTVNPIFFEPDFIEELFVILPSLRALRKNVTQLKLNIISNNLVNDLSIRMKEDEIDSIEEIPIEKLSDDPLGHLDWILGLASQKRDVVAIVKQRPDYFTRRMIDKMTNIQPRK